MLYLYYVLLVGIGNSVFCYVKAVQYGLPAKRWGIMGLVAGPILLPMLQIERRLAMLRHKGITSIFQA